jgi:hypothetical protein
MAEGLAKQDGLQEYVYNLAREAEGHTDATPRSRQMQAATTKKDRERERTRALETQRAIAEKRAPPPGKGLYYIIKSPFVEYGIDIDEIMHIKNLIILWSGLCYFQ